MEPLSAIIPAQSERQALDWSLVLVSQGIESTVEAPSEEHGWRLVMSPADHDRAVEVIHLYGAENRPEFWQQPVPWTDLMFDWRSVIWFAVLVVLFAFGGNRYEAMKEAGMMQNAAVSHGEWWRMVTAVMLHKDAGHLISNVTTGVLLLGLAMGAYGSGIALLGSFLAGVGGNAAGWILYDVTHRGLGASGMVMGALGMLTVRWLVLSRPRLQKNRLVGRGIFAGVCLFIFWGTNPDSDVVAHAGGFITGAALGLATGFLPEKAARSSLTQRAMELCCGLLVVLAWALALTRS